MKKVLHIVLYEPEIPQNTGNIMRTCAAFNMHLHLIEPLGFVMDEKHLRRSGLDYRSFCSYRIYPDWQHFLDENEGSFYYVTRYGKRNLIFGKESTGIPKAILAQHLERCMRIPMVKEARSLNLSNCVALCAYTVLAQLGFPGLSATEYIKGEDWLLK